jgi:hypothetical protein
MAAAAQVIRQRDFSAGEIVEYAARRDDDPMVRAGGRQMENFRVLSTGALEHRPGRTALFPERGRVDEVAVDSDTVYRLCFGNGTLKIRDSTGAIVTGKAGFPWEFSTVHRITWAFVDRDVVICFPGTKPVVARWDGETSWNIQEFAFANGTDSIAKVPFARVAKKGITMLVSAVTGTVDIDFSDDVLTDDHVGTIIKWANKRLQVATVADARNGTATCLETLLQCQRLTVTAGNELGFSIGDAVIGSATETEGVVVEIDDPNNYVYVQLLNFQSGFTTADVLIGPFQRTAITAVSANATPRATVVWEEQAFGDAYGWPQSCTADVSRLIFCDIPGLPEALAESAVGAPDDFDVGTAATSAIVELMTGKPRIYHILGGQDQFLFTSKGVFYIPISESNPLAPGSITFRRITTDAASTVRPVEAAEGLAYINAGGTRVIGVTPTGQTAMPYVTDDLAEMHAHLLSSPVAIVATTGDGDFPERYLIIVNSDGTLALGRYNAKRKWWGFWPWTAADDGTVLWVSTRIGSGNVLFCTKYEIGGSDVYLCELLAASAYLDAQVEINAVPAALQAQTETDLDFFPTAGTAIGDLDENGGLTALDDGDTTKTAAQGARNTGTSGFYGRSLMIAQPVKRAVVYATSDSGFSGAAGNVTIELKGSNTAPNSDGSNGTTLGSITVPDVLSAVEQIASSDTTTAYLYVWVRISRAGAATIHLALATFLYPGNVLASASGGTGDLWFFAGGSVEIMDGLLSYGTRAVDADGDLTLVEGDDFGAATVAAGLVFNSVFEPFVPHANEGQSAKQALQKRSIQAGRLAVQKSTGFDVNKVSSGATLRREARYQQGEDQADAPAQREYVAEFNVPGSEYDPRFEVEKTTPGTLRVTELSYEITV